MRKDIILSGVGGQGILTIATIIGEAATAEGINLKQDVYKRQVERFSM